MAKKKTSPKKAVHEVRAPKVRKSAFGGSKPNVSVKRYLVPGVEPKSILSVIGRPEHDIVVLDAEYSGAYEAMLNSFEIVGTLRYSDQQFAGDRGDEYVLIIRR